MKLRVETVPEHFSLEPWRILQAEELLLTEFIEYDIAILHFWLDAKLHFVVSVLVLCAITIKFNLKKKKSNAMQMCQPFCPLRFYLP